MKKIALLFLLLFLNTNLFSQDLKRVDKIISSYMKAESIESLASRIDYDFETKIEKVRAIYTWIALNITYNVFSANSLKAPEFIFYSNKYDLQRAKERKKQQIINKVFKNKKGVCYGYSLLFNKLCNLINIKNELVYGYSKSSVNEIGVIPHNKNHVWNAVKIKDNWLLFDVTYGSGYNYKGVWQKKINLDYFDVKKEKLRLTHFPSNTFWQFFLHQKPLKEFCYEPFYQNAFLKHKIKFLTPNIGEIKINNKKDIHLKIRKLKNVTSIKYIFSHENIFRNALIKNQGNTSDIYWSQK